MLKILIPNESAGIPSPIYPADSNRHLWVSFKKDTTWTEPQNLGPKVNTAGADGAPGLSRDDKTLYFLSNREHAERPVYPGGKVTAEAFDKLLHSTKNGMRFIYEINIADLKAEH
ncbi:hypothetical protein [Mucilaginibacter sp.]|uniref:hypothetical protein n=1 Tax=Mucilaginibacter sp. TaxID=1882438 RepID=UPI0025D14EA4|nr:hypothetical protein [Mucilaginibacter sp.]